MPFSFFFFGDTAIIFAPLTQGMAVGKPNSPCFTLSTLYIFWDIFYCNSLMVQSNQFKSFQGGAFAINGLLPWKAFVIVE